MRETMNSESAGPVLSHASFSLSHRIKRAAWNVTWKLLASWTPPPLHRWRNLLLRLFGAKLHRSARVYGSAKIWYPPNLLMGENSVIGPRVQCYSQGLVTISSGAIVSQGAHLCAGTHDISDFEFRLITKPITVESNAWVAAEAFIGPGATVREGAVVGARAVLFGDTHPWGVYIGNPAKLVKQRVLRSKS